MCSLCCISRTPACNQSVILEGAVKKGEIKFESRIWWLLKIFIRPKKEYFSFSLLLHNSGFNDTMTYHLYILSQKERRK